jgi:hypothetical protein
MRHVATLIALVSSAYGLAACDAPHEDATRVFVRDPHQVWVEARTGQGERMLLPPGDGLRGVSVRADVPPEAIEPARASVFREPSGGITVDHPSCAPWPTNPLSSRGELRVTREHGQKGFSTEGPNLRIPFKCETDGYTVVDLSFVTPLANVREVHVIEDAVERPIAGGSTDPVLQAHPWEQP